MHGAVTAMRCDKSDCRDTWMRIDEGLRREPTGLQVDLTAQREDRDRLDREQAEALAAELEKTPRVVESRSASAEEDGAPAETASTEPTVEASPIVEEAESETVTVTESEPETPRPEAAERATEPAADGETGERPKKRRRRRGGRRRRKKPEGGGSEPTSASD